MQKEALEGKELVGGTVGEEAGQDNKGLKMVKVYCSAFMKCHNEIHYFVQILIKYDVFNILYCIFF